MAFTPLAETDVLAPNFKRRLSGVTATIVQLIPKQRSLGVAIAAIGPGLPDGVARASLASLRGLWSRPRSGRRWRVWHARRNVEMLAGVILRDLLRMRLKLLFTSASQRKHTGWSKFLIRRMDAVVATSSRTAAYLEVPHDVIVHGIDTDRFHPAEDRAACRQALGLDPQKRVFGCFGRIRHQKGTDLFVDAMIALLPDLPDWTAVIGGRATGEHLGYQKELEERVRNAGLADRIRFVGEIPIADMPRWYQALDVYVAPSRHEGFGLTPLEAMACGVPSIAGRVGAYEDLIVDGETGSLCVAGDAESFRAACALWRERAEAADTSVSIRDYIKENFRLEGEALKLAALYDRLAPLPSA